MTKLNVATLANNFFKVYYFEQKKRFLTGAAFFSIPLKSDLLKGGLVLNCEDTKSLLLPQIARASDQIKFRDTVFLIPTAEVYTFVANYEAGSPGEEVFNQAKANLKYNFEESEIVVKGVKDGKAQAFIVRSDYIHMVKDVFKSPTFKLNGIVPITEVLTNITNDVSAPHILIAKVENELVILLINNNLTFQVVTLPITEAKEVPKPEIASADGEIITADKVSPKTETVSPVETASPEQVASVTNIPAPGVEKKVLDAVAKLQKQAQGLGFQANEIYLADSYAHSFQNALNTDAPVFSEETLPADSKAADSAVDNQAGDDLAVNAEASADSAFKESKPSEGLSVGESGLQTSQNVVKIVQVPFDEGLDSTAFTMILPNETYSKKGVNFWYLGDNPPAANGGKKHMGKIIIVVLVILLLGGGGVWYFLQRQSGSTGSATAPTPTAAETPITVTVSQSSPTASPTPSVALERKNLKVQVYNGGGKTGEASRIKGVLEGKGYVVVGTGNNPNGSSETTELQLKPTKKEYLSLIKEDLKSEYAVTAGSDLPESSGADAVLVIGTK